MEKDLNAKRGSVKLLQKYRDEQEEKLAGLTNGSGTPKTPGGR